MNSSMMFRILSILPSLVWSNWKSAAQTTFGRIGHMAPTATPMPRSGASSLAVGHTQAFFPPQAVDALVVDPPAGLRAPVAARRQPQRGRRREKSRRNARSASSSSEGTGGGERWVERGWPTTPTRPALGDPELLSERHDGPPAAVRG